MHIFDRWAGRVTHIFVDFRIARCLTPEELSLQMVKAVLLT